MSRTVKADARFKMVWDMETSLYVSARKIDQYGVDNLIYADKIQLTQQLGVQLRDLRVLEPSLACSYPSALFCRDKALIINLEDINCIITTQFVLIGDGHDIAQSLFVEKLQGDCVPQNGKTDCLKAHSDGTDSFCHKPFELKVLDLVLHLVRPRVSQATLGASARLGFMCFTEQVLMLCGCTGLFKD